MPEHFMEVFPAHGCVVGRKIVLSGGSGRGFSVFFRTDPSLGMCCTGRRCLRSSCASRQWVTLGLEGTWTWGSQRAS